MRERSTISRWWLTTGDEWQLGPEPRAHELLPPIEPAPTIDLSASRLTRAVHVLTFEHLAWGAIAIWAAITRFLDLGMAPLAPYEARHALFEYDLVNRTNWASSVGYHPGSGGWIHLVEAGLLAAGGVSDFSARVIFAVAGLLMIAAPFLMRRYIGRAGAIAASGLITISPTFTYFSRTSAIPTVVAALATIIVVAFTRLMHQPNILRAIGLGIAGGLLGAAGSTGLAMEGILVASLTFLGVHQLTVTERPYLDFPIWLRRYGSILTMAIIVAVVAWLLSQIPLFKIADMLKELEQVWVGFNVHNCLKGLQYYAPGMLLYDFLITLTAIFGLIVVPCMHAWSRLFLFSLFWLMTSFLWCLGNFDRDSERLVLLLLPMVMVGATGMDYLHHTRAWPYARVVVLALGAATVYVQVLVNFIYPAPAANEPQWKRHSNLYWDCGATTVEARTQLRQLRGRFPESGGTIFNYDRWQASLRWYLREFRPTRSPEIADLIVYRNPPPSRMQDSDFENRLNIDLQQSWEPAIGTLNFARAILFVFTAGAWAPLQTTTTAITMRTPSDSAPTLILPPS